MLVAKEHKRLLLNLREPEQVVALIPGATMREIRGKNIVSVPHDLDTVRVLRNLGLAAPSPIRSYYEWPGLHAPFIHQYETSEFLTLNPRAFCLNGMGSGKTLATLWAYDYLRSLAMAKRMLVVSPLSTLERTWGDEIFKHFPHLNFAVLHGTPQRRMQRLQDDVDIYIINHDGVKDAALLSALAVREGLDLVAVDELATFRNSSSQRWKALNLLCNGDRKRKIPGKTRVWGLTGTPTPNGPEDAWAQCKLINPTSVPPFFGAFRDQVMRKITQYKWAPKDTAWNTVQAAMQPAVRFATEDCVDLPPTVYLDREVALTREQAGLYKDMMTKFKAEFEGGQITAMNEAVRISKLLQIVCGVAYTDAGDVAIPAQNRVDEIIETIHQAGAKVIVFVPLTGALASLHAQISKDFDAWRVDGGTPKAKRDEIFADFMSPHGRRVLVAQPGTMAHGLTLTSADTIIWYAPIHSAEIYQQANARIVRPGQKRTTRIVRIQGSPLERKMYEKLEKRESSQGLLLDMFK